MIETFEDFCSFYEERGFLPNDVGRRKNTLNEKQLYTRFQKYLKSEEKKRQALERYYSKDEKWEELKSHLDLSKCTLCERLKYFMAFDSLEELQLSAGHLITIIDPAHIFGKGAYPHMKYDIDNVVSLNRFSHSMLDQNRDPINGNPIKSEEVKQWWTIIVGLDRYEELFSRSRNGYAQ